MSKENPWKSVETLARFMHRTRCDKCEKTNESLITCPTASYWTNYAKMRMERRFKASIGKFGFGKPQDVTRMERRMIMGEKAKDLKDCLEQYIKGLIDNNLTLEQVSDLYSKMMEVASINKKYKESVCVKTPKKTKKSK